ncbi:hypothetical protein [Helicobacter cetorum]|uniref:hypothetical protein n=1 Tax=Helicobacter cetorum TaxID=138563 RepID=UPI000CF0579E|nr:hypothetical protein [Helicobacter cetorum]
MIIKVFFTGLWLYFGLKALFFEGFFSGVVILGIIAYLVFKFIKDYKELVIFKQACAKLDGMAKIENGIFVYPGMGPIAFPQHHIEINMNELEEVADTTYSKAEVQEVQSRSRPSFFSMFNPYADTTSRVLSSKAVVYQEVYSILCAGTFGQITLEFKSTEDKAAIKSLLRAYAKENRLDIHFA